MLSLGAALTCAGGCIEDVMIGSDCPGTTGPCRPIVEVDGGAPWGEQIPDEPEDAAASTDDAAEDTSTADASTPVSMPLLRNPSFELTSPIGVAGEVTALNLLRTDISPWYTCQPIGGQVSSSVTAVRAETGLSAGDVEGAPKVDVMPTDGRTFISIGYLVNIIPMPLLQDLVQPLREGERYAFAIDVLTTSPRALLSLEVRGNNEGCLGPTTQRTLFTSEPITSLEWRTVCVDFVAPSELGHLILASQLNAESTLDPSGMLLEGDILGGPRLFFDRIRQAEPGECP